MNLCGPGEFANMIVLRRRGNFLVSKCRFHVNLVNDSMTILLRHDNDVPSPTTVLNAHVLQAWKWLGVQFKFANSRRNCKGFLAGSKSMRGAYATYIVLYFITALK